MPRRFRPAVERVEDRLAPALLTPVPDGAVVVPLGADGRFRVINPADGTVTGTVQPFGPDYTGEVRAATGDVNGDGVQDLVVGAGPGGAARVVVVDGRSGLIVTDFFAFDRDFRGGVYVAAGDVNHDNAADIIVGAGEGGGPVVRVFDGRFTGQLLAEFLAFEESFRGGARVAAGDVSDANFRSAEIVVGAGAGGAPRVSVFRLASLYEILPSPEAGPVRLVVSFMAYDPALRGGVSVTTAGAGVDFASASRTIGPEAKVVTGAGLGGAPHVKVFSGTTGQEYFSFYRGDEASRGGANVTGNRDGITVATPTPVGPALVSGPWTTGQVSWALPPGASLVIGVLTADTGGDVLTILSSGETQVFRVAAGATVERGGVPTPLGDVKSGDRVTLTVERDGTVSRVSASLPRPPVIVHPPTPVPAADLT